jgi:predicted dehydrogenase
MADNLAGADAMIAAAQKTGRMLAIFQNLRYDPVFMKVREIVESGVLGRVNMIRRCMHMFRRRWDWQTVRRFGGGSIRNNGAHTLDQLMHFTDPLEPGVFCRTDRVLTCGDAEDFAKVILTAPGKPLIDLEVSSNCATPQSGWLVTGERGSLEVPHSNGQPRRVIWKLAVGLEESASRRAPDQPVAEGEYMQDNPEFEEHSWEDTENLGARGYHLGYYRDLAATLRKGAPLAVTTESVRRRMVIIEECLRQAEAEADN